MKEPKIQGCKAFSLHISGVEQRRTHTFIEKYACVAHTRLTNIFPDLDCKNFPSMSFHHGVRDLLSVLPSLATCSLACCSLDPFFPICFMGASSSKFSGFTI